MEDSAFSPNEVDEIRPYHDLMVEEGLSELSVQDKDISIHLVSRRGERRREEGSHPSHDNENNQPIEQDVKGTPIKALLSGMFYRSPSPTSPPFVNVGDTIKPDQVVCILEAMKVMNEIRSPIGGVVKKILAENGQSVRSEQVLFIIE